MWRSVALAPSSWVRVANPQRYPLCLARTPPLLWVSSPNPRLLGEFPPVQETLVGASFILVLSPTQSKRKFERDCREAEKAAQTAERLDQDINATKADVEKVPVGSETRLGVRVGQGWNWAMTPSSIFLRPSNKPTFGVTWQKKAKMSMQPNYSASTETRLTSIFPRCPRYLM